MEPTTEVSQCAYCMRKSNEPGLPDFKRCGACKLAWYCSAECQRPHWKVHKAQCKRYQEAAKENESNKRTFRIFESWRQQAKDSGILSSAMLMFFGVKIIAKAFQEEKVACLSIQFNYNRLKFLPITEPGFVTGEELENAELAIAIQQTFANMKQRCKLGVIVLIAPKEVSTPVLMPLGMEESVTIRKRPWKDIVALFGDIQLHSKKFSQFLMTTQINLKAQISNVVRHPSFLTFLTNALRMESREQRHETHVVVVEMSVGFGLGQVEKLESFRVEKLAQLSNHYQGLPSSQMQMTMQQFDLKNHPTLIASRQTRPHNKYLPVLFKGRDSNLRFVQPNLSELYPNHNINSTKSCDRKSQAAFRELQKINFPKVQSPSLD